MRRKSREKAGSRQEEKIYSIRKLQMATFFNMNSIWKLYTIFMSLDASDICHFQSRCWERRSRHLRGWKQHLSSTFRYISDITINLARTFWYQEMRGTKKLLSITFTRSVIKFRDVSRKLRRKCNRWGRWLLFRWKTGLPAEMDFLKWYIFKLNFSKPSNPHVFTEEPLLVSL